MRAILCKRRKKMNDQFDYIPQNDQPPYQNQGFGFAPQQPEANGKGYAIASLCLGIASVFFTCICCCLYYVAIVTGILAIIMACISKSKNGGKMSGMAIAGLILGILGIILFLVMVVFEAFVFTEEFIAESFEEFYGMPYEDFMESYMEDMEAVPIE